MNRYRRIEICSVANRFAWVVADPTVDRRKGIVDDQLTPSLLVSSGSGVGKPRLDILAGRAPGVARRHQVDVNRATIADRARAWPAVQQIGHGRHVTVGTARTRGRRR